MSHNPTSINAYYNTKLSLWAVQGLLVDSSLTRVSRAAVVHMHHYQEEVVGSDFTRWYNFSFFFLSPRLKYQKLKIANC